MEARSNRRSFFSCTDVVPTEHAPGRAFFARTCILFSASALARHCVSPQRVYLSLQVRLPLCVHLVLLYLVNDQLFYTAGSFLEVCDENGYTFETLVDAQYSTMMVSSEPFHGSDTVPLLLRLGVSLTAPSHPRAPDGCPS